MGFLYTATQDGQTISASGVLFQLSATADVPIRLHWLELGVTSDLGDAEEEVLMIRMGRGGAISDGAALTEVAIHDRAPAAATSVLGIGTGVGGLTAEIIPWNIRKAGPVWIPLPADRFRAVNTFVTFRLNAAPNDALTFGGTVCWEEL